jgi:hypothetical protein
MLKAGTITEMGGSASDLTWRLMSLPDFRDREEDQKRVEGVDPEEVDEDQPLEHPGDVGE